MKNIGIKTCALFALGAVILGGLIGAFTVLVLREDKPLPKVTVYEVDTTRPHEYGPTEPKLPELFLIKREETGEEVNIITSYCTLSHPYAYTDLIEHVIVANDDRTAIDFYARVNGGHYPLYSFEFGGEGDIELGTLQLETTVCSVRATIHDESDELAGDELTSFRAAQEVFNDIWESLTKTDGFTPAQ